MLVESHYLLCCYSLVLCFTLNLLKETKYHDHDKTHDVSTFTNERIGMFS